MDSKPDPIGKVLSTAEIREMILKDLDILSLVNCRRVSKSWKGTASSILKKRPVWIRRLWDSEKFDQLYNCVERSGSTSTDFPFRGLDLSLTGKRSDNMSSYHAAKFFTTSGTIFTHLRAKCSMKWQMEMVRDLLKRAEELQYLELGTLLPDIKTVRPEFLPSLRILKFGGECEGGDELVLERLIRAAPNLKDIQQVHCDCAIQMNALRNAGKFHLVSSMILTDFVEAQPRLVLTANPPQLTALTVEVKRGDPTRNFIIALKALLLHNASTLKKLEFCNFPVQIFDEYFLVFDKLEELVFKTESKRCRQHDPVSAVVRRLSCNSFSKLKKIRLDTGDGEITKYWIQKHFWGVCEAGVMSTVDKLELESYCGRGVFKYLAKCFPQVTHIALNYQQCKYDSGSREYSEIWLLRHFHNLSKLDIHGHPFKLGIMDSFLTGIPKDIVANLRIEQKQYLSSSMSRILRTRGNILQLKNLKELIVAVVPPSSGFEPSSGSSPLTMVSIWYALELMPGLRASFLCCSSGCKSTLGNSADFQTALEPVKNYVTIGQCFCDKD